MSYSAPNSLLMPARHSIDVMSDSWLDANEGSGSAVWPSANLAIYVPVGIPSRVVVVKLWFGSNTTGTGNVDMALYDSAGTAVIQATAAAKGTTQGVQVFDTTDTTVGPGLYYIGISSDSATDTYYRRTPAVPACAAYGLLTEASAYPLPATATWAVDQTLAYIPWVGLLLDATVA